MKLFLDDIRYPPTVSLEENDWIVTRSFKEAFEYLDSHPFPEVISFDHDLGMENGKIAPDGFDLVRHIEAKVKTGQYHLPSDFKFHIHSANPVGANNIKNRMFHILRMEMIVNKKSFKYYSLDPGTNQIEEIG